MILLQVTNGNASLIMFGMIFLVMYFFMIRPQIRKQRKEQEYRSQLKKGDKIITIGGIHGKIIDVKDDVIIIEVHGATKLKVAKNAVSMTGDVVIDRK